ncbi:MAG: hypothetical protein ACEY3A_05425 [Wolbachia sp.]
MKLLNKDILKGMEKCLHFLNKLSHLINKKCLVGVKWNSKEDPESRNQALIYDKRSEWENIQCL